MVRINVAEYTSEGIVLSDSTLHSQLKQKLYTDFIKKMEIKEIPANGAAKHFYMTTLYAYIRQGDKIIIPAEMALRLQRILFSDGLKAITNLIDVRDPPGEMHGEVNDIELYPYQASAIDHIVPILTSDNPLERHVYLQMDTGLGKTRLGVGVIVELAVPTIIIVPSQAIADQWLADIRLNLPNVSCTMYANSMGNNHIKYDINLVIINTAIKKDSRFMSYFGLMILDEAHEYCSKCRKQILWLSQQVSSTLALSATPNVNPNGLDWYVNCFMGKVIRAAEIPNCAVGDVKFTGKVTAIKYYGDPDFAETITNTAGTSSAILTIGEMLKDKFRLKLLVDEIVRLMKSHCVMVFAELRDFLIELRDELVKRVEADDVAIPEILRGGSDSEDMERAKKSRIVLTTYGYSRRGISIRDMTALVLATPRKTGLEQIVGRILRRGSDETIEREIVDIIDMNSILKTQFESRKRIYEMKKYPITKKIVKFSTTKIEPLNANTNASSASVDELFAELISE
jgi:superfamily II DNA or RNA helicase